MLGSQFHALLRTPWDPGPSQTLCCHAFLLRVKRTDGTGRKGRVCLPGDSRVGLIREAQPSEGSLLAPLPHGRVREHSSASSGHSGRRGCGSTHWSLPPPPSSLSRLLSTQRPQGTGSQSICKDPPPEGGPRMYCLPRLIVNAIPEDSSWWDWGAEWHPLTPQFPSRVWAHLHT